MSQEPDSVTVTGKRRNKTQPGYPHELKCNAVALAITERNNHVAAEAYGVSECAVRLWRKTLTSEEIARGAEDLAQNWEERAARYLLLADAREDTASFMQLITAASIATEKRTLLRGKDTHGQRSPADPDVLREKLKELLQDRARTHAQDAEIIPPAPAEEKGGTGEVAEAGDMGPEGDG